MRFLTEYFQLLWLGKVVETVKHSHLKSLNFKKIWNEPKTTRHTKRGTCASVLRVAVESNTFNGPSEKKRDEVMKA